eukprot:m.154987 g.154987  ORF g.154987 m.154987 type:complete len:926 (+) comp20798_c0_seq2:560-3337(+)
MLHRAALLVAAVALAAHAPGFAAVAAAAADVSAGRFHEAPQAVNTTGCTGNGTSANPFLLNYGDEGCLLEGTVDELSSLSLRFFYNQSQLPPGGDSVSMWIPRLNTDISRVSPLVAEDNSSVSFVTTLPCATSSFDLPLFFLDGGCRYTSVARSICPVASCAYHDRFTLSVSSYTRSTFRARVRLVDVQLQLDQPSVQSISTSEPVFVRYFWNEAADGGAVNVAVRSAHDANVAVVSIQNASCPVFDLPTNFQYQGLRQTFTDKADVYVERSSMTEQGFYIVFLVQPTQDQCQLEKTVTVAISAAMPTSQYARAVVIMLIPYLVMFAVTLCVMAYELARGRGISEPTFEEQTLTGREDPDTLHVESGADEYAVISTPAVYAAAVQHVQHSVEHHTGHTSHTHEDWQDQPGAADATIQTSWDQGNYHALSKYYYRSKVHLMVSDLTRKPRRYRQAKFRGYILTLCAVCVFYALPVLQLVLGYLSLFNDGRQDLCYYNFECARPLGRLHQFNNIASNAGYVCAGCLFILIVWRRSFLLSDLAKDRLNKRINSDGFTVETLEPEDVKGLPRDHGIFYAAGVAMVCEGLFSALYHICPTAQNFQFDVAFMFIIGGLLGMALYQRRHSDTKADPGSVYICFAAVILLDVVGVYWSSTVFYSFVFVIFIVGSYFFCLQIYYLGQFKFVFSLADPTPTDSRSASPHRAVQEEHTPLLSSGGGGVGNGTLSNRSSVSTNRKDPAVCDPQRFAAALQHPDDHVAYAIINPIKRWYTLGLLLGWPRRKLRFVYICLFNILNFIVVVVGLAEQWEDVSSFFLGIVICNLLIYFGFYFHCKVFKFGERPTIVAVICMLSSLAFWAPALYFFTRGLTNWGSSPAVSREGNRPCILLDFYDAHDVWHMLSAFALFFSCLLLLVLDSDVDSKPRSQIPVF